MFTSLLPGLAVTAVGILVLRFVLGFLLRPPQALKFRLKVKLIRFAAYWSVRAERFWKNRSDASSQKRERA
jgi:uncharacterized membrane protein